MSLHHTGAPPVAALTRRIVMLWLAAMTVVAAARHLLPQLLRRDLYEGDLCQHVWWTSRFADPGLFPGDPIAAYMSRPFFAMYGWQLVYRLASPLADAQVLAETIALLLVVPLILLAWLLGRRLGGPVGGVGAVCFILASGQIAELEGGLPRSFALPLLLGGTLALIPGRPWWFGGALLASALFYPPITLNLALTGVALVAIRAVRERRLPVRWWPCLVAGGVALGVLLLAYAPSPPASIGPRVTADKARSMPEYWPGGPARFFEHSASRYYVTSTRSGFGMRPLHLLTALIVVAACRAWLRVRIPLEAWVLVLTAVATMMAAHATLFSLHFPNRYVKYALPVFGVMWTAVCLKRLDELLRRRVSGGRLLLLAGRPAGLLCVAAVSAILAAGYAAFRIAEDLAVAPPAGQSEAHAFLAGMPRDTLVAAHPRDADGVMLNARRSVLASRETLLPYFTGYWASMRPRLQAELTAFHASRLEEVDVLHAEYGVDVFLVDTSRYSEADTRHFAPFEAMIRQQHDRGLKDGFILRNPPPERILFRSGDFLIVRVGPPRPGLGSAAAGRP